MWVYFWAFYFYSSMLIYSVIFVSVIQQLCTFLGNMECFVNLRFILVQGPCLSSPYHSNFSISAAEVNTISGLLWCLICSL